MSRVVRQAVRAPFALTLAAGLIATSIWTQTHPSDVGPLLQWASTNVHNLSYAPIRSFIVSALFMPDGLASLNIVLLLATVIPLERRVGTVQALLVFASAHVVATLLTEGWVWYSVHTGAMAVSAEYQDDVGVSYGMFCVAAAVLCFAPRGVRALGVAALGAYILVPFVLEPDMTSTGHVLSLAIGLAWWPLLTRISADRSQRHESVAPHRVMDGAGIPSV